MRTNRALRPGHRQGLQTRPRLPRPVFRRTSVAALSVLVALPWIAHAGGWLLLGTAPEQSASDPRVRFWEALEAEIAIVAVDSVQPGFGYAAPGRDAAGSELVHAAPGRDAADPGAENAVSALAATEIGAFGVDEDPELEVAAFDAVIPEPDAVFDSESVDFDTDTDAAGAPPRVLTFTVHPRHDGSIVAAKPNAVYGTTVDLRARGARAEHRSYIEFFVTGCDTTVLQATLRLYCLDGSDDAGLVYAVAPDRHARDIDSPWTQEELTWNNAPRLLPVALALLGRVVAGSWVEIDVTAAIDSNGSHSFALVSRADDMVAFASREGSAPPELVLVTAVHAEAGNGVPFGIDDAYTFENQGTLEIFAPGLLENDSDPDGDVLALVSSSQPAHGTVVAMHDGAFTYRPEAGYFGPDSFTYCVSDGRGGTGTVTVALVVQPGFVTTDSWTSARDTETPTTAANVAATRIVPNPSRGHSWIEFDLPRDSSVDAAIYDARGHRVRALTTGVRSAGRHQLPWNGANDQGNALPTGIYFLRLQCGDVLQSHKIVLQR